MGVLERGIRGVREGSVRQVDSAVV
jgi:hypothetical protein